MKTIILPGYSEHNREWAEDVANDFRLKIKDQIIVHKWRHWVSPSLSLSLRKEIESIKKELKTEKKFNILAKSVGVFVCLNLIHELESQVVNKVILCGIASVTTDDRKSLLASLLGKISVDNILCIQNENDKYVKYSKAENFYHSVEPKLKVVSMPRSDHEYPYADLFLEF